MTTMRFLAAALVGAAFINLHYAAPLFAQESVKGALTLADFDKLHKELQPPRDELWRTIPWYVSIVEAQHAAAKTGKPIFVWVASGEPLGCG